MSRFEFYWPWMGLLLLLPLLVRYYWPFPPPQEEERPELKGRHTVLLHPALVQLRDAFHGDRPGTPLATRVYGLLLALLWLGLVLALMRPQWLDVHTQVKTEGYDLMLAVDASHSMDALDFTVQNRQVSRMQVLKGVMGRFIEQREGDRVGLVIFGDQSYVLSPLTLDRQAVHKLLDGVVPSIAGQGTAMGDAIGLGVKKLRARPEGSRVLILIADGESTSGSIPPLQAARIAAHEGVRIYAIGVGSNQENVQIIEQGRLVTRNDLGLDEDILRDIAEITGGAYFRATDTDALEAVYQRIDELEKSEAEARSVLIPTPLYRWPLGFALLCLLALGMFPDGQRRVWRTASQ